MTIQSISLGLTGNLILVKQNHFLIAISQLLIPFFDRFIIKLIFVLNLHLANNLMREISFGNSKQWPIYIIPLVVKLKTNLSQILKSLL